MPSPRYEQSFNTLQSDAFRHEYERSIHEGALYKDIESYLGEYRFQLPVYHYDLRFSFCPNGEPHLRDYYTEEPMIKKGKRAIERRRAEGKNISRETAELEGMLRLEQQLEVASDGDTIVWISPPGPEEDGYGDYGFVYVGRIKENLKEKQLSMEAYRLDNLSIDQANALFYPLIGQPPNFIIAEQFLANPLVVSKEDSYLLFSFFQRLYEQVPRNNQAKEEFNQSMRLLQPYINEFITMAKNNVPKPELRKVFNAIENMAIELKNKKYFPVLAEPFVNYQIVVPDIRWAIKNFGHAPPAVGGSCGSSGRSSSPFESPDIFKLPSLLREILGDSERYDDYNCPECGQEIKGELKSDSSTWTKCCPHCGHKFNCAKHS